MIIPLFFHWFFNACVGSSGFGCCAAAVVDAFVLRCVSFSLWMPFLDNNDEVQLEWNRKG